MLIDSHCHLSDDRFDEDRPRVLARAVEAGVERILSVASNREDAQEVLALLEAFHPSSPGSGGGGAEPGAGEAPSEAGESGWRRGGAPKSLPALWGTAGVHPHDAEGAFEGDLDRIREILRSSPRMAAVGETGLDFFYDNSPRAIQEELFRGHMELAEEMDLPVVVHSRNADALTGAILREWEGRVRGVLHCFTGGPELLRTALQADWMISFTGLVTFKNFNGQKELRAVPADRLMVETDGPYLAPVPHRGRRNEPAYVARVAEGVARHRDETAEEVARYTTRNAIRFFGMKP